MQPFTTSARLVELLYAEIPAPARRTGGHPAKRTFQALRMEVNDELAVLRRAVPAAIDAIRVGGRVVVESYHSLEDRLVKQAFTAVTTTDVPHDLPFVPEGSEPALRLLTRGAEKADAGGDRREPSRRLGAAAGDRTSPAERERSRVMSSTAPQLRSRLPRLAEEAFQRARLTVVPGRRTRAPRVPFVTLVSILLLGGVIGLLLFNTSMQQASFAASALEEQATNLSAREQTLQMELERLRDPQRVAEAAKAQGLVIPAAPAFLDLETGEVTGNVAPGDARGRHEHQAAAAGPASRARPGTDPARVDDATRASAATAWEPVGTGSGSLVWASSVTTSATTTAAGELAATEETTRATDRHSTPATARVVAGGCAARRRSGCASGSCSSRSCSRCSPLAWSSCRRTTPARTPRWPPTRAPSTWCSRRPAATSWTATANRSPTPSTG